jgi:hypothetical protein
MWWQQQKRMLQHTRYIELLTVSFDDLIQVFHDGVGGLNVLCCIHTPVFFLPVVEPLQLDATSLEKVGAVIWTFDPLDSYFCSQSLFVGVEGLFLSRVLLLWSLP